MSEGTIRVNGAPEAFAPNVAVLLAARGMEGLRGVAVAVNDRVVPRSAWGATALSAGDEVEIVRAVGGG